MAARYSFSNKANYFSSVLSSPSSSTTFTIQSSGFNKKDPDSTSVTSSSGKTAVINWRKKHEVGVDHIQVDSGRYPIPSVGKSELIYEWQSVRRWTIDDKEWRSGYHKPTRTWKAFRVHLGEVDKSPIVIFHQHNSKLLAKSEPATVIVESGVSEEEVVVVLITMLWSKRTRMKLLDPIMGQPSNAGIAVTVIFAILSATSC